MAAHPSSVPRASRRLMASRPKGTPTAFSNELGQFIFDEYKASVIFIELRPKKPSDVKDRWDFIDPIPPAKNSEALHAKRAELSGFYQCGTGFIMKKDETHVHILTVSHLMGCLYNGQNQMTCRLFESLYDAYFICDHHEHNFKDGTDSERLYCEAKVAAIRCTKDLMLMTVTRRDLKDYCSSFHPTLQFAPNFPNPLEVVMMISWPIGLHSTVVCGKISNLRRNMEDLTLSNICEHSMELSEVDMTSSFGSSGGPLIDGSCKFVGLATSWWK